MQRSKLLVAAGIVALATQNTAFASPGNVSSEDVQSPSESVQVPSADAVKEQFRSSPRDNAGRVSAIVELKEDPVAVVETKSGRSLAQPEKDALKAKLKQAQGTVTDVVQAKGGIVSSQMQSAYNGVQVVVTPEELAEVVKLPKVKAVHPVVSYEPSNSSTIPYLGVDQVWKNTGYTGKNIKVAIIDGGIDYTHANFRGPGTVEAYKAARSKSDSHDEEPDPTLFGPNAPRVKGGWDFVGDAYGEGFHIPLPDSNPLDCGGHGTHVAGSLGGNGVLADGSSYSGPYDESISKRSWEVGPGVAPEVDLYALKVFGCTGSTRVVTEAIDWAVEHGMQVINLSLSSPHGTAGDPTAVAATNAVAAGIVVVASSGNNGPAPYLTGSPGSSNGVISVAASDTRASFPGAYLQLSNQRIGTININGKGLPSAKDRLRVAVLRDNPSTAANEAAGCSVEAYRKAGINPNSPVKQLAVVESGSCDGEAKALSAQQAGVGAAVVVNTINELPVTEAISSDVKIPLLGAKSSDSDSIKAAEGQDISLKAFDMSGPNFSTYASFSASGPRVGDSALRPSVTAPGVAIRSAGFGTGNKGALDSGTSMATPMVAGVAALGIQAHPDWKAQEIAAMLANTADPTKIYWSRAVRGGGLVNPVAAVRANSVVFGDSYSTKNGNVREGTLSFGFADFSSRFNKSKAITIVNKGKSPAQYTISVDKSVSSVDATVGVSRKEITIPAGQSRDIWVNMTVEAKDVPSSLNKNLDKGKREIKDQARFYEVSGQIRITQKGGQTLRVPYLMVPRSNTEVAARQELLTNNGKQVLSTKLTNAGGALTGSGDFYTWGFEDPQDTQDKPAIDIRAVGVQSTRINGVPYVVFALNMYGRYSSGAVDYYSIEVDTNGDGVTDWTIFSYDEGGEKSRLRNGKAAIFVRDSDQRRTLPADSMAIAPADSSTILLPVRLSSIGLPDDAKMDFSYKVRTSTLDGYYLDSVEGWAKYNREDRPMEDAVFATVDPDGTTEVKQTVNPEAMARLNPLGTMIVAMDNRSGADEAITLRVPRH